MKNKTWVLVTIFALSGLTAYAADSTTRPERPSIQRGQRPPRGERPRRDPMKEMDQNGDGKVSSDEFKSWGTEHPRPNRSGNQTEDPSSFFDKLDQNKDGTLSSDEMRPPRPRASERPDPASSEAPQWGHRRPDDGHRPQYGASPAVATPSAQPW